MKKHLEIIITSILILASAASCINITVNKSTIKDGMHENYQPPSSARLSGTFSYSADQSAVMQELGIPTRFTILFGENNRLETWHYDTRGYTVAFMNGTKTSERTVVVQYRDDMYATTYTPGQFYAGMRVDEIVLATGRDDFQLSTIEAESFEQRLMHLEGLAVGLQDDSINYIETYPAMTERRLTAAEFVPISVLTPEESANQGQHEYLVVVYENFEVIESINTMVDVIFEDDQLCLTLEGETTCFVQVAENHYQSTEIVTNLYIILDGFIWNLDDEISEMEVLFSRVDD